MRWGVVLLLLASSAFAAEGETARQILDRRKALDDGARAWSGRQERLTITTRGRGDAELVRELLVMEARAGDDTKTLVLLEEPALLRGSTFLSHAHPSGPDDQWFRLGAASGRPRQMGGQDRSNGFFDSVLTFADIDVLQELGRWTEAEAASTLRDDDQVEDVACHVIVLAPKRDEIGYTRVVVWLGKDDLVARKIQLFTGDEQASKELVQTDIRVVDGIPVAHRTEVSVPGTRKRSSIETRDVRFNRSFPDGFFTSTTVERGGTYIREQFDGGS